ncbi:hypothetical protein [Desulfolutivibrio sulfoxidireducens]|uniref:hypothetical protein n=1 Tax=Desulfolutivibrio sulfoxidireducens TaxID=2773299 RepID=UPI001C3FF7E2|nr:hypothetical protein [Desulfolutivibrio sulfoxidireducens]QLA20671.1 hypothetical protein GD604_13600 [Desulfolutivibrio sulfoxidireducens]
MQFAFENNESFWCIDLVGLRECFFTREVRHMGKLALEITEEPIIGNAGLAAMGELKRIGGVDSLCAKRESRTVRSLRRTSRGALADSSP